MKHSKKLILDRKVSDLLRNAERRIPCGSGGFARVSQWSGLWATALHERILTPIRPWNT